MGGDTPRALATGQVPFGATQSEWAHFAHGLKLAPDVLPVVSRPGAIVSPRSKLRDVGKVPSVYNDEGDVVGLSAWTTKHSTMRDVSRWMAVPDLGICIQTRQVRALDLDIEDQAEVDDLMAAVFAATGAVLPMRWRRGSPRAILVFRCDGFLAKRSFRTLNGIVEFLGNGQQFVACGTHKSGERYQWAGGLPAVVPEITPDGFEALWAALVARFAVAPPTGGPQRLRQRLATIDATDGVAAFLAAEGHVLDEARDGTLYVACPWTHEHSSDSGPTATAWFPAGTNGYEQGHFRCLHAHCDGRTDVEFLDAIGYRLADFDAVPEDVVEGPDGKAVDFGLLPLPALKRNAQGEAEATLNNLVACLSRPSFAGCEVAFDEACHDIVVRSLADAAEAGAGDGRGAGAGGPGAVGVTAGADGALGALGQGWRPLTDVDVVALRARFEIASATRFKPIGRELMRDALMLAADGRRIDTVRDWLTGLVWDGVPRVDGFLARYFACQDRAYVSAVSRYWWTAQAGRALAPGCQVDMVPVLVGDQGEGKSQALKALLPGDGFYYEINLSDDDDKLARNMRGVLTGEIAELRGLRSRDADSIKAWITRQVEKWVPKFVERSTSYRRRLLFVGTTNDDEFLDDPSGERRWLPVMVGGVDIAALARDRDQLWAEGAALFGAGGVAWRDAYTLAKAEHGTFKVRDVWEPIVRAWLAENEPEFVDVRTVAVAALGLDVRQMRKGEEMRIGKILRLCGWVKRLELREGVRTNLWRNTCNTCSGSGVAEKGK